MSETTNNNTTVATTDNIIVEDAQKQVKGLKALLTDLYSYEYTIDGNPYKFEMPDEKTLSEIEKQYKGRESDFLRSFSKYVKTDFIPEIYNGFKDYYELGSDFETPKYTEQQSLKKQREQEWDKDIKKHSGKAFIYDFLTDNGYDADKNTINGLIKYIHGNEYGVYEALAESIGKNPNEKEFEQIKQYYFPDSKSKFGEKVGSLSNMYYVNDLKEKFDKGEITAIDYIEALNAESDQLNKPTEAQKALADIRIDYTNPLSVYDEKRKMFVPEWQLEKDKAEKKFNTLNDFNYGYQGKIDARKSFLEKERERAVPIFLEQSKKSVEEIDKRIKTLKQKSLKDNKERIKWSAGPLRAEDVMTKEEKAELKQLELHKRSTEDYAKLLVAPTESTWKSFIQSFKDKDYMNLITLGWKETFQQLDKSKVFEDIAKKQKDSISLTSEEKNIIKLHSAFEQLSETKNIASAYNIGSQFLDMLPFMAEIFVGGLAGSVVRNGAKQLLKNTIKKEVLEKVSKFAEKKFIQNFIKPLATETMNAVLTTALNPQQSIVNYAGRKIDNYEVVRALDGEFGFQKRENAKSESNMWANAIKDAFIENWSEGMGFAFDMPMSFLSSKLNLGRRLGFTMRSPAFIQRAKELTRLNSYAGELGEEYLGAIARTLGVEESAKQETVRLSNEKTRWQSEVMTPTQVGEFMGAMGIMQAIGFSASAIKSVGAYKNNSELRNANKQVLQSLPKEVQAQLKQVVMADNFETMSKGLKDIKEGKDEKTQNAIDTYVYGRLIYDTSIGTELDETITRSIEKNKKEVEGMMYNSDIVEGQEINSYDNDNKKYIGNVYVVESKDGNKYAVIGGAIDQIFNGVPNGNPTGMLVVREFDEKGNLTEDKKVISVSDVNRGFGGNSGNIFISGNTLMINGQKKVISELEQLVDNDNRNDNAETHTLQSDLVNNGEVVAKAGEIISFTPNADGSFELSNGGQSMNVPTEVKQEIQRLIEVSEARAEKEKDLPIIKSKEKIQPKTEVTFVYETKNGSKRLTVQQGEEVQFYQNSDGTVNAYIGKDAENATLLSIAEARQLKAELLLEENKVEKQNKETNPQENYKQAEKILHTISDEEFENPINDITLPPLPTNTQQALGINDRPVLIKKNIIEKNRDTHFEITPNESREIIIEALYNPNLVGQTQPQKREHYYITVKTGNKNSLVVVDVFPTKDNIEVIGWRYIDEKGLERLERQAEREGGQILILSPIENGLAVALSALTNNQAQSNSKDTKKSEINNKNNEQSDKDIFLNSLPKNKNNEVEENKLSDEQLIEYATYVVPEEYLKKYAQDKIKELNHKTNKNAIDYVKLSKLKEWESILEDEYKVVENNKQNKTIANSIYKVVEDLGGTESLSLYERIMAFIGRGGIKFIWGKTTDRGSGKGYTVVKRGLGDLFRYSPEEMKPRLPFLAKKGEVGYTIQSAAEILASDSDITLNRDDVGDAMAIENIIEDIMTSVSSPKDILFYFEQMLSDRQWAEEAKQEEDQKIVAISKIKESKERNAKIESGEIKRETREEKEEKFLEAEKQADIDNIKNIITAPDFFFDSEDDRQNKIDEFSKNNPDIDIEILKAEALSSQEENNLYDEENAPFQIAESQSHISENGNLTSINKRLFNRLINQLELGGLHSNVMTDKKKMAERLGKYGLKEFNQVAELISVNARFNEELKKQIQAKNNPNNKELQDWAKNHIYNLGNAGVILQSAGFRNQSIELKASRLSAKSMQDNHPFDLSEVENLPNAIQNPLAVFNSSTIVGRKLIFTELDHTDNKTGKTKNFIVAVELNAINGKNIEINDIRSVYPRNNSQIISAINNEYAIYLDKDRIKNWISKQQFNSAEVTNPILSTKIQKDFKSAIKKVEDFENPKISNKNLRGMFLQKTSNKQKQFKIIQSTNPMRDDYHTGIRSESDILTAEEAFTDPEIQGTPDFTKADMRRALKTSKITIYSSYPIQDGVFVTPSKMEAQAYAGNGKIYSKEVSLSEVAWIDILEGQYAPIRLMMTSQGEVYGFTDLKTGEIYIDIDLMNANTPIHEFGHLWVNYIKQNNTELYKRGVELIKNSPYYKQIKDNFAYSNISEEEILEESLVTAIGDKGEMMLQRSADMNDLAGFAKVRAWLTEVWEFIKKNLGIRNLSAKQLENITLDDFLNGAVADMLSGQDIKLRETQEAIKRAEKETDTNPTEAQKKAGNYKMGHVNIQGFDISIENPKGSVRSGVSEDGKKWSNKMANTYGYFGKTESKDGDHIDLFLGNNPLSDKVFVVDQVNPEDGKFDEHKVMFGFDSIEDAEKAYYANYEKGWQGLGNITETDVETFRKWVKSDGRRIKPFAEYAINNPTEAQIGNQRASEIEDFLNNTEQGKKLVEQVVSETGKLAKQADKVSAFIKDVLDGKIKDGKQEIELPESANRQAEQALGHPIKSHRIKAEEIRHINKNHGENGKKNTENSIPLRKEDVALLPYIMGSPDIVTKGNTGRNNKESVRYYKNLSNGYIVVVEQEVSANNSNMENITMWAEKNRSTNATSASQKGTSVITSKTSISQNDIAKIQKNFETAIEKGQNLKLQALFGGNSGYKGYSMSKESDKEKINNIEKRIENIFENEETINKIKENNRITAEKRKIEFEKYNKKKNELLLPYNEKIKEIQEQLSQIYSPENKHNYWLLKQEFEQFNSNIKYTPEKEILSEKEIRIQEKNKIEEHKSFLENLITSKQKIEKDREKFNNYDYNNKLYRRLIQNISFENNRIIDLEKDFEKKVEKRKNDQKILENNLAEIKRVNELISNYGQDKYDELKERIKTSTPNALVIT
ncbi:hypothetical protein FACS1894153_2530 [Bacteroidia bacterium]|nr:hypothetical protein FACS1894153_2530 [Bacteroidia bacterium]